MLRDRFARYLPVMHQAVAPRAGNLIPDEQLLDLLLNLDIMCGSEVDRARATYDAALPPNGGEPSFDDVIAAGWLRVVWGRVATPFEIDQRARAAPDGTLTALVASLKKRFDEKFTVRAAAHSNAELQGFAAAIERGDLKADSLRCQTPEWVAARLWDRALSDTTSHSAELRLWIVFWAGRLWHKIWTEKVANAFRESALVLLETEPGLTGWEETRDGFVRQISLRTGQPPGLRNGAFPNCLRHFSSVRFGLTI
jgi:hypothetical protein